MEDIKPNFTILVSDKNPLSCLKQTYFVNDYVHKFFVYHTYSVHRDIILASIMKAVEPQDFIPFNYKTTAESATFLVKNCILAIKQLCTQNLLVQNIYDESIYFKLEIVLGHSTSDDGANARVMNTTQKVVSKRFDWSNNIMNFNAFHKDKDIDDFCPLSQPKILIFVLQMCKSYSITTLLLGNNGIKELPEHFPKIFLNLTTLDLSNNDIISLHAILAASYCPITKLTLEGNPLCAGLNQIGYIKQVRASFNKVKVLDDVPIEESNLPISRQNFLCDNQGQNFVEEFLEEFYLHYDGQRRHLINLYHNQAMFSLTKHHIIGQNSSNTVNFKPYEQFSRNFKFIADFSKGKERLWVGSESIINIFEALPKTEHDSSTFTIDLLTYTEKLIIICVNGVFRDNGVTLNSGCNYFSFKRTFVLTDFGIGNRFLISNDQMHISNATTQQEKSSFHHMSLPKNCWLDISPATTMAEENELIRAINNITGLNYEWSLKILKQCGFNLMATLHAVIEGIDNFPVEAFVGNFIQEEMDVDSPNSIQQESSVKANQSEKASLNTVDIETLMEDAENSIPISKVNDFIKNFLDDSSLKLFHDYAALYDIMKKYKTYLLKDKVVFQEKGLDKISLQIYGNHCKKLLNTKHKYLELANKTLSNKIMQWFGSNAYFDYDFSFAYRTLEELKYLDIIPIIQGYEKKVVQTILISIKSLINVTKRVNGLKQLAKYIENGQKLSFAQFKVIYTTNIEKSAYAFNEAKLLSLAKTSLTKDDYWLFEDFFIDDTLTAGRVLSRSTALNLINKRILEQPKRCMPFRKLLPIIEKICPMTANSLKML